VTLNIISSNRIIVKYYGILNIKLLTYGLSWSNILMDCLLIFSICLYL
jgi:hypothetical protein